VPFFLHQWLYKDTQVRSMVCEAEDRAEIVRVATEAFGGKLHHFFYCFGDHDGVAVSEFPDQHLALACVMAILGQGRIVTINTIPLFTPDEGMAAMRKARQMVVATEPEQLRAKT
jgi:uncharacterized protein with GYD domain